MVGIGHDKRLSVIDTYEILARLLAALAAGALIGYERSFHGRPAGFRTHALVCTASALLMLVTVFEAHWVPAAAKVQLDPTRMAHPPSRRRRTPQSQSPAPANLGRKLAQADHR